MLWHISYQINSTQFRLASWSKTKRIQNTTWETRTPHLQPLFFWFPPFLAISFNPTPELLSPANRCLLSPYTQWVPIATASSSIGHMLLPTPRHHQHGPPKRSWLCSHLDSEAPFAASRLPHILRWQPTNLHQDLAERQPVQWSRLLFVFSLCNFAFRLFAEKKNKPKPTHTQTNKEILLSTLQITLISVKAQLPKKSLFKSSSPPPAFGFFLVYNLLWILEAIDSSWPTSGGRDRKEPRSAAKRQTSREEQKKLEIRREGWRDFQWKW